MNDIWRHFETEKKRKIEINKSKMKKKLRTKLLEISGHFLNKKNKEIFMSLKE